MFSETFKKFSLFLSRHYPDLQSITHLSLNEALIEWYAFLKERGISFTEKGVPRTNTYVRVLKSFYLFTFSFYYPKRIDNSDPYKIRFEEFPAKYRETAEQFLSQFGDEKKYSKREAFLKAERVKDFLQYIEANYPHWENLAPLQAEHLHAYYGSNDEIYKVRMAINNILRAFILHNFVRLDGKLVIQTPVVPVGRRKRKNIEPVKQSI